jgi:DNA-binding beta-propeller fold protein YncE
LGPIGIAFDGTNIWVANQSNSTVTEVRVSDGGLLGVVRAGAFPQGIAFDGVNIWVADENANMVSKL